MPGSGKWSGLTVGTSACAASEVSSIYQKIFWSCLSAPEKCIFANFMVSGGRELEGKGL